MTDGQEQRMKLIAEIAKEFKLPFLKAKKIVDSQSLLVSSAMEECLEKGVIKKVRLPHLGTFSVIEEKLNQLGKC